jgi:uncharacterized protein
MIDLGRDLTAEEVAAVLKLRPHPEGGFYRETFRDAPPPGGGRAASTAIYYLLPAGCVSAWHRVDAAEIWHYYAGAPLELRFCEHGRLATVMTLGPDIVNEQRPQGVVPPGWWQSAQSLGAWTLVGCTVAPAFAFAKFELAPEGFAPEIL